MAYRCDQAVFGGAKEAIRCRVSGTVCAHQKMCMMEGRIVLTDGAMRCPARDGQLPPDEPEPAAAEPAAPAEKPVKKTTRKKTAAGKKG